MVETTLMYGSVIWTLKEEDRRRINAVKMDYLRRSAMISRRERRRNEEVRNIMSATETVSDRIEKRSLKWFGHLLRMEDGNYRKRLGTWQPQGRKIKGVQEDHGTMEYERLCETKIWKKTWLMIDRHGD